MPSIAMSWKPPGVLLFAASPASRMSSSAYALARPVCTSRNDSPWSLPCSSVRPRLVCALMACSFGMVLVPEVADFLQRARRLGGERRAAYKQKREQAVNHHEQPSLLVESNWCRFVLRARLGGSRRIDRLAQTLDDRVDRRRVRDERRREQHV